MLSLWGTTASLLFKEAICHRCQKRGHLARECRHRSQNQTHQPKNRTNYVEKEESILPIYHMEGKKNEVQPIKVQFDGKELCMEVDTGAALSVMPERVYKDSFLHLPLKNPSLILPHYKGEHIPTVGQISAPVSGV